MNQGRIWCVVKPTVGLPLLLGSVTVIALTVHYAVLTNTTWFSGYWNGHAKAKAAQVESSTQPVAVTSPDGSTSFVINVAPAAGNTADAPTSFVVTVAAKPVAPAQGDGTSLALAAPSSR